MGENAVLLEFYLALAGKDKTVLPGGYVLVCEEGSGTPLESAQDRGRRRLRAAADRREVRRVATLGAARPGFAGPRRGNGRAEDRDFPEARHRPRGGSAARSEGDE
jgi:hypothetical protein